MCDVCAVMCVPGYGDNIILFLIISIIPQRTAAYLPKLMPKRTNVLSKFMFV